jgi:hypothetical protein
MRTRGREGADRVLDPLLRDQAGDRQQSSGKGGAVGRLGQARMDAEAYDREPLLRSPGVKEPALHVLGVGEESRSRGEQIGVGIRVPVQDGAYVVAVEVNREAASRKRGDRQPGLAGRAEMGHDDVRPTNLVEQGSRHGVREPKSAAPSNATQPHGRGRDASRVQDAGLKPSPTGSFSRAAVTTATRWPARSSQVTASWTNVSVTVG